MPKLIDKIAESFGYVKTQPIEQPAPDWLRSDAEAERFNLPGLMLPEAQAELYQRLSWVQIAVNHVSNAASMAKFNVTELSGEAATHVDSHPFEQLLRLPNPLQSRFELLRDSLSWYLLTGNAYWWLNRTDGNSEPDEIWLLPANKVEPVPDENLYLRGYVWDAGNGKTVPLELHEVVHFRKFHPSNSYVGLSPIEALATVAEGDLAMQQWNRNFFGENNAKLPGILTVNSIGNDEWSALKDVFRRKHGGTKRELAMLRNVAPGDVNWVGMSMPQSDMEFLAGRQANKEEIFGIYAPGLSSILDVNATEANSTAGKQTFIEFAVWPNMVAIAEKITNDLLPAYGDNLQGEFEDIRPKDQAMKMAEMSEFARYHTIDEVRIEFFGDDPIGDERGELLAAQIGQSTGVVEDDPEPMPEPEPVAESEPDEPEPEPDEEEATKAARITERRALKNYLKNRPNADPSKFENVFLTAEEVAEIAGIKAEDADSDDAPFPVVGWEEYP